MKWKPDLHLNKTEVRVDSVVEILSEVTTKCLQGSSRKLLHHATKGGGEEVEEGRWTWWPGSKSSWGDKKDAIEELKTSETSDTAISYTHVKTQTPEPNQPTSSSWSLKNPSTYIQLKPILKKNLFLRNLNPISLDPLLHLNTFPKSVWLKESKPHRIWCLTTSTC